MNDSELVDKAKGIIAKILYITLATVSRDSEPWNSPLYTAYDEHYNFYVATDQASQHAQNIANNNKVFAVIYDSTVPEGVGTLMEGVYMQATADMLTDRDDIRRALAYMYTRKGDAPDKRSPHEFQGDYPRRVYKITPHMCWINVPGDKNGNYIDIRHKISFVR